MAATDRSARISSTVLWVKGVMLSLLAIVHFVVALTFERGSIRTQATESVRRAYLVWFSGVGAFILFLGLVDVICAAGLKANSLVARRIARLSTVFCIALGGTGMVVFAPFSPPGLIAALGAVGLVVLWRRSRLDEGSAAES